MVKSGDLGGGVLCCFREVCDCVDETGECYANGDSPEPCVICEGDGDPVEPLTVIEECSPDAGVEPEEDLGPGPNDPDLGPTDPEISFRGDGGCECRTAGDGAPTFGLLALVLFAVRRRRR